MLTPTQPWFACPGVVGAGFGQHLLAANPVPTSHKVIGWLIVALATLQITAFLLCPSKVRLALIPTLALILTSVATAMVTTKTLNLLSKTAGESQPQSRANAFNDAAVMEPCSGCLRRTAGACSRVSHMHGSQSSAWHPSAVVVTIGQLLP